MALAGERRCCLRITYRKDSSAHLDIIRVGEQAGLTWRNFSSREMDSEGLSNANNGSAGGEAGAQTRSDSVSVSAAEKHANTSTSEVKSNAPPVKLRSCVVCRSRKVRCDKESPCSNCRRANIPCIFPSADRPPRWARRLGANHAHAVEKSGSTPDPSLGVGQVLERLKTLESLVSDLSGQLEQAHAAAAANSSTGNSPASSNQDRDADHVKASPPQSGAGKIQAQFGRLVLGDANRSRYVSSGFWSRINDVLDELKTETKNLAETDVESSDDEKPPGSCPSTLELDRTPSERHAFLFRHNLQPRGSDLQDLHPMPSQVPFLLDVFSENVNGVIQIVHMPTISKVARHATRHTRGTDMSRLSPVNEALLFAVYYAAVTSMEEEDIAINFTSSKTELNLKYRLGLEQALAKADFLNVPDLGLVQAFAIFLFLVRRHDSPRFVWMMTGLVVRMAQALGLQRDPSHFNIFTPFEAEMRRRVWWALLLLDVRSSEDQGTDFSIQYGSFDTRIPLNINDADIDPHATQTPVEREGITDMSLPLVTAITSNFSRQMMLPRTTMSEQDRLLGQVYAELDKGYLKYSKDPGDIAAWVAVVALRVMCGKLTLLTHLPVLFSSPGETLSEEIQNKLLITAIEVAEFNHALNAEQACRHWRWLFQTYTQWHAIVYILIDISRRPWSSTIERAWLSLQSPWLIPSQHNLDKNLRIWVPFRSLMTKARDYRASELTRLRSDKRAAQQLEEVDRKLPLPSTVGPVSVQDGAEIFRRKWRDLVGMASSGEQPTLPTDKLGPGDPWPTYSQSQLTLNRQAGNFDQVTTAPVSQLSHASATISTHNVSETNAESSLLMPTQDVYNQQSTEILSYGDPCQPAGSWDHGQSGLLNWFWASPENDLELFANSGAGTTDMDLDLDPTIDWGSWVESAKGVEMDMQATGESLHKQ
ncbi:hypothetical protein GGR57DRAFT_509487 [Xylariaceae sp. FL1272]|nr:hypothetical protein GGR57DRAFT_509487 [Xylariaceae sp. FL1272]